MNIRGSSCKICTDDVCISCRNGTFLAPWSRILQYEAYSRSAGQEFSAFFEALVFITVFTRSLHWSDECIPYLLTQFI